MKGELSDTFFIEDHPRLV